MVQDPKPEPPVFPLLLTVLASASPSASGPLDLDVMRRCAYTAGGPTEGLGGFGSSGNTARPIEADMAALERLTLAVAPEETPSLGDGVTGLAVYLVNPTDEPVVLSAQDSMLSMVQEARGSDGEWAPIEHMPQSWCGNSYHTVALQPTSYWRFTAPRYTGDFATEIRFRLDGPDGPLYSAAFDGHINQTQFGEKQGHTPGNIMDPYQE
ncbi:MAG: hypothetical protein ACI8RZ_006674 [Myxococcota bacterium]|jgi:hypothetical protein